MFQKNVPETRKKNLSLSIIHYTPKGPCHYNPPALMNDVKYLRAGPTEMPSKNW